MPKFENIKVKFSKIKIVFGKRFTPQYAKLFLGMFLIFTIGFSFYILDSLNTLSQKNNFMLTSEKKEAKIQYSDFHLVIPKIKVDVPVIKNVDGYNKVSYLKSLEKGVAHFKETALPNQKNNCFIFGHSSYFKGKYKEIFKKLPELKKGDEFSIWYQEKEYIYRVRQSREVAKNDLSVLAQDNERKVTLMTCYPIGTAKARWIIVGVRK